MGKYAQVKPLGCHGFPPPLLRNEHIASVAERELLQGIG
jgi:hypothetical protein